MYSSQRGSWTIDPPPPLSLTESNLEVVLLRLSPLGFHLFATAQERLDASDLIPDVLAAPLTAVGQRRVPDAVQAAVALQLVFILVGWN